MQFKELVQANFNEMSKGQKKVAVHVMDNPEDVAMSSAQELGEKIGVSETTVIRFCHRLSLPGYSALQKNIQHQFFVKESSLLAYQESKEALEQTPHFFETVMQQDRLAIAETMKKINEDEYTEAIEALSKAETIYVLGLRSSYAPASWLSLMLGLVKERVHMIHPDSEDVIQTISQMNEKSVVIVISFHRYVKKTIQLAKLAHEQQTFIIGITDSHIAPIHLYSRTLFPIYSPNKTTIDATAALFSFLNALVAGLSVKEKDTFQKRQEQYQSVTDNFLFIEEGRNKDD